MKPIGMFDSGLGGLTVMKELMKALPHENFLYFGDTAHVPYGNKSKETIIRYSLEIAHFLMEQEIKLLIIACNSATALALDAVQNELDIPVIGVINPGVKAAIAHSENQKIAVLGTRATIQSEVYQSSILSRSPKAQIFALSCPLFVPLVEENYLEKKGAKLIVKDYLAPLKSQGVDTVLLGCTHYPLMKTLIKKEVGHEVAVIDSASSLAHEALSILSRLGLIETSGLGAVRFFVSDDPQNFRKSGEAFLKQPIDHVKLISEISFCLK